MKPEFLFDFGSPNAYLCHALLPGIEQRTGTKFTYVPILLGGLFKLTKNQSPMAANDHIPSKTAYMRLEMERFIKKHGLTGFKMNPHFPVNTLLIMRGAVVAETEGMHLPYANAMFHALWEDGQNLADPIIARAALNQAGFDGTRLLARAQEPAIKEVLLHNTQHAADRGAFGAPTFFVGAEIFFGKDRLVEVEDLLLHRSPGLPI